MKEWILGVVIIAMLAANIYISWQTLAVSALSTQILFAIVSQVQGGQEG
jgi:hypothetical protein